MSFLRHEQIYQSDVFSVCAGAKQWPASPRSHRLDESATGYSLAGCSPALPASASPAVFHAAPNRRKQSSLQRLLARGGIPALERKRNDIVHMEGVGHGDEVAALQR